MSILPKNSKVYVRPEDYYANTKDRLPRPILLEAFNYLSQEDSKNALDFGCGAGADTKILLEKGFIVEAVDGSSEVSNYVSTLEPQERLKLVIKDFEDFEFDTYNLINASYSLPFIKPKSFASVFDKLKKSLLPGGIFVGQFFGNNDEWAKQDSLMTFVNKEEALKLLEGLELIKVDETLGSLIDSIADVCSQGVPLEQRSALGTMYYAKTWGQSPYTLPLRDKEASVAPGVEVGYVRPWVGTGAHIRRRNHYSLVGLCGFAATQPDSYLAPPVTVVMKLVMEYVPCLVRHVDTT